MTTEINDVVALVKRLEDNQSNSEREERRKENRYPMVTPIQVQPVNDEYTAVGDAFTAVSRDISRSGMSLITSEREESHLLSIRLIPRDSEEIRVILRVGRRVPVGNSYYELAGEFVKRL